MSFEKLRREFFPFSTKVSSLLPKNRQVILFLLELWIIFI